MSPWPVRQQRPLQQEGAVTTRGAAASGGIRLRGRRRTPGAQRAFLEHSGDGLVLLDRSGEAVEVAPSYVHVLGYTPAQRYAMRTLDLVHRDDHSRWQAAWAELVSRRFSRATIALRARHARGQWFWVEVVLVNRLADPAVGAVVATIRPRLDGGLDLTPTGYLASQEGPPGRAAAVARLADVLACREGGDVLVLFVKLDQFHLVARACGWRPATELAAAVVRRLAQGLRACDELVSVDHDRLVVICPTEGGKRAAPGAARRITAALAEPFSVEGHQVVMTASIGITLGGSPNEDAEGLLSDADLALATAVAQGGNCRSFFYPAERADALAQVTFPAVLRHALTQGQFVLYYQPVVELGTGAVVGAEALMRWAYSEGAVLGPAAFIPAAERSGVISALGSWAIREACRVAAPWPVTGNGVTPYVAVNLSAHQLENPRLPAEVQGLLAEAGMEPNRLVLEVTEGVLVADQATAGRRLRALREFGVRVAVDDFGTGYSSLAYLKRLPVDVLKIDRSFVTGLGNDKTDTSIVAAVITLARALGLDVVAEGVETEVQAAELLRLGCSYAQGYLYGRPVPVDELDTLAVHGLGGVRTGSRQL